MSPALTYTPAYLGLLAAQILAVTCNSFLDIQYGVFSAEVLLWSIAFSFSLWIGWMQKGEISDGGRLWMRRSLIFGGLVSLVIFIPMWGFPRAGLYMLAMLQVSYNCVTTTRRHLHLSLLISLVMVMFAASHYRADWTMLFYLVPYVTAVVFTLVAEQINRKAGELRQQSLANQVVGAQGAAIVAATAVILILGLSFYALTPQVNWMSLSWIWGQHAAISLGEGELLPANGAGNAGQDGAGGAGGQGQGQAGGTWLAPGEMRQAAARKGMPEWQRSAIGSMADMAESLSGVMQPVMQDLSELWEDFKKWLQQKRDSIMRAFILLAALALLYALWRLLREARAATWLRTRYDYLALVWPGRGSADVRGACQYYVAMMRLFELQEIERGRSRNAQEYLSEINLFFREYSGETGEITRLYEDARYGSRAGAIQVERMRDLYRKIYRRLAEQY